MSQNGPTVSDFGEEISGCQSPRDGWEDGLRGDPVLFSSEENVFADHVSRDHREGSTAPLAGSAQTAALTLEPQSWSQTQTASPAWCAPSSLQLDNARRRSQLFLSGKGRRRMWPPISRPSPPPQCLWSPTAVCKPCLWVLEGRGGGADVVGCLKVAVLSVP
uniref:Uncharacterized protein n=1 Tax=Molossus molossus TaxID=27622 RepID=A0A7J8FZH7_MOLMO|nr:hypothetical protein HJG59_008267 [Molossus molossus]